jgi:hypothetical protein
MLVCEIEVFSECLEHVLDVLASSGGCLEEIVELLLFHTIFAFTLGDFTVVFKVHTIANQVDQYILICVVLDFLDPCLDVFERFPPM